MQQTSQLRVVAAVAKSYDEWTDAQGNKRPAGVTYRLWLSEGFSSVPFEASCSEGVYSVAKGLGAGSSVRVSIDFSAKNDRLVAKVVDFAPVEAPSPQLAAVNGRK